MLLELMVAAVIGLSFGNAWTCILLSFGTSSEKRSVGKWFILGRFLGLIILGSAISLLRFAAQDIMLQVLMIFGVSTILFGVFMLISQYLKLRYEKEHSQPASEGGLSDNAILSLLSLFMVLPGKGKCKGGHLRAKNLHGKHGHHKNNGPCRRQKNIKGRYGFALGVLRGATPCAKVLVLAPLLVSFGYPASIPIILVYASVSTVYPVIGYLSADILTKFEKYKYAVRIIAALILITLGLYSIIKVLTLSSAHLGA